MNGKENLTEGLTIRTAEAADAPLVAGFMQKLGTYQRMADHTTVTAEKMRRLLEEKAGEAIIGELEGKPVAMILYYGNCSGFIGETGVYIDGFYIEEAFRRSGIGRAMMERMAQIALERGCRRMEWGCLDWNEPALNFYRKLGANAMDIMTVYRMTPDKMEALAGTGRKAGQ